MTYKKLLELITDMSAEQQEMPVIVATENDGNTEMSMMSQVCHNDSKEEDDFEVGQPILS